MAANDLVESRLDFCNSLFRSLSALVFCRLQCVHNCLNRVVANTTKYSQLITPVRKSLQWLPIMQHCHHDSPIGVHSCYPKYFEPFLKPRYSVYRMRRSLSDDVLLKVPHFTSIYNSKKHFGLKHAYDAPRIWNELHYDELMIR